MWINQNDPAKLPVVQMSDEFVSATNFYIDGPIITAGSDKDYPRGTFMLYAAADKVKELEGKGYKVRQLQTFQRYWVSRLKPSFLNKATRAKELTQTAVVIISR